MVVGGIAFDTASSQLDCFGLLQPKLAMPESNNSWWIARS